MYLLVLELDYNIKIFDNQLRIPFNELDEERALTKAYEVIAIWQGNIRSARLFELHEVGEFNFEPEEKDK